VGEIVKILGFEKELEIGGNVSHVGGSCYCYWKREPCW
jgi:hypothetical protein